MKTFTFNKTSAVILKRNTVLVFTLSGILFLSACVKEVESLYISDKEFTIVEIPTWSEVNGLYFFDENTGFVVGDLGLVFKTTDGGKTWEQKSLGKYNLADIHFCNENVGYVVGWTEYVERTGNTSVLHLGDAVAFRTTDGGENWIITDNPDSYFPDNILCLDENRAVIPDGAAVHITTDGHNWDSVFFGQNVTTSGNTTIYTSIKRANEAFLYNDTTIISVGIHGGFITSDLFKTREPIETKAEHISILDGNRILSSLEKSVWISDPSNYQNLITEVKTDEYDDQFDWSIYDIEGISEDYFMIIVGYHIYRTKDSGKTWDSIIPRDGRFRKLQKAGEKYIFGIGSGPTIYLGEGSPQYLIKIPF